MGSIAAKKVAKEVLETLGKGKRPNLGKIIKKNGYSKKMSLNPKEVTDTKSFKEVVDPFIQAMITQRQRAIDAIASRKLTKDKTRDLTDLIDKLTKNIQLLNGGKTSNEGIQIGWE